MSEADGQLRAFIERILRLKEERGSDVEFARTVSGRVDRLRYTLEPLAAVKNRSIASGRAEVTAARLLGVQTDTVRHRANMVRRHGGLDMALEKVAWLGAHPWDVPELDGDLFGFVYVVEAVDYPGVFKIGFSRSPRQRLVALKREFKIRLGLVCYAAGTEFDEHMIQHDMVEYGLAGEWFDLGKFWEKAIPAIRLYTAKRMWNEMREAA